MNSNYEKRALINTNNLEWQVHAQNVFKKVLSTKDEEETYINKYGKFPKLLISNLVEKMNF